MLCRWEISRCWAVGTGGAGITCCQTGTLLFSSLLPPPGSPEPRAGGTTRAGLSKCASCPGMLPQCCLGNGTQPQPPAPLRDPGDYEGLFSDAGSGSDRSVLSDVGPREFPSLQWNKTTEAALFHFPSGWPPWRGHPAHQLWGTL